MKTIKLWFERDKEIPRFKRLRFGKVCVPLADILKRGIHPWHGPDTERGLGKVFIEMLNQEEFKVPELLQFDYCMDISGHVYVPYRSETTEFEEQLKRIGESIYFVDTLPYTELLALARERLKRTWSHETVVKILSRTKGHFDAMRSFIKARDKNIKLTGYADLENYDLGKILRLEDFDTEDGVLISEGLHLTNFRLMRFLAKVTDENGLLRLTERVQDFEVSVSRGSTENGPSVLYNCRVDSDRVRFLPDITTDPSQRSKAKSMAPLLRLDNGRYCFTADIAGVSRMIEEKGVEIRFPTLGYIGSKDPDVSSAEITESEVPLFEVGGYLTRTDTGDSIREALRVHNVSMTGRKEQLLDKLAKVSVKVYKEAQPQLDAYFSENRFIRISSGATGNTAEFPLLQKLTLGRMVLTMYIIKHMRGNVILEASHHNESFDLLSLARALVKREVFLNGSFARVG